VSTICNSTPLIHLSRVGHLELLRLLFARVLVPQAVITEVLPGTPAIAEPLRDGWIVPTTVADAAKVEEFARRLGGAGEAEVIALALEHPGSTVLVDERAARLVCQELGLNTRGTLGVLLEAKSAGHLPAVGPVVDLLLARGFWLDADTRELVLRLAGEHA
jgi:uncharacterized protein